MGQVLRAASFVRRKGRLIDRLVEYRAASDEKRMLPA